MPPTAPRPAAPITTGSNNLISLNSGFSGGVISATDPKLAANGLQNNGGPTPTIALQTGSPAVGGGVTVAGVSTDQRGLPRSSPPSLGAFEADPLPTSTITTTGAFNSSTWTGSITGAASGLGLASVQVSIFNGSNYWNGASFGATSQTFVTATGTTSWSYAFPLSDLTAGDSYTVQSKATDVSGKAQSPLTTSTFTYGISYTYLVTTTAYSGSGSLSAAIASAVGIHDPMALITFSSNLAGRTIQLNSGDSNVDNLYGPTAYVVNGGNGTHIVINAANAPGLVIDGGNAVRLFAVATGNSLTLEDLTLRHGLAAGGQGGTAVKGGGAAGGAGLGGAVLDDGGIFAALGCTFSNDSAQGGKGGNVGVPGSNGPGGGGGGLGFTAQGGDGGFYSGGIGGGSRGGVIGNAAGFGGGGEGGQGDITYTGRFAGGPGGSGGFGGGGGGGCGGTGTDIAFGIGGRGGDGGFGGGGGGGGYGGVTHGPGGSPGYAAGAGGAGGNGSSAVRGGGGGGGAGLGGGIFSNGGSLTLTNDTFTANSATGGGGGAGTVNGGAGGGQGGAVFLRNGSLNATFDTFTLNTAAQGGTDLFVLSDKTGGGNSTSPGSGTVTVTLNNDILGQSGTTTVPDFSATVLGAGASGPTYTGSNNLITFNKAFSGGLLSATDPKLDPAGLQNNGGPTQTIPLLAGSPAISAGLTIAGISTDQRGLTRTSPPSLGAYEAVPLPTTAISTYGLFDGSTWTGSITGTASGNGDGIGITGVQISIFNGNHYWNGSSFSGTSQTFVTATGATSWSYALPLSDLAAGATYTVQSKATDADGHVQNPLTTSSFSLDVTVFYVVTTTSYDGNGSLGAAIASAVGNHDPMAVITFSSSLAGQTIQLNGSDVSPDNLYGPTAYVVNGASGANITINASAAPGLLIDGGNAVRLFAVTGGDSLTLEDLTRSMAWLRAARRRHAASPAGRRRMPAWAGAVFDDGGRLYGPGLHLHEQFRAEGGNGGKRVSPRQSLRRAAGGGGLGPDGHGERRRRRRRGRWAAAAPVAASAGAAPAVPAPNMSTNRAPTAVSAPAVGVARWVAALSPAPPAALAARAASAGAVAAAALPRRAWAMRGAGAGLRRRCWWRRSRRPASAAAVAAPPAWAAAFSSATAAASPFTNDTFTANSATGGNGFTSGHRQGGAVFQRNGSLNATFDTFTLNSAAQGGTDLFVLSDKSNGGNNTSPGSGTASAALINDILGQSGIVAASDFADAVYGAGDSAPAMTGSHDLISVNNGFSGGTIGSADPKLDPSGLQNHGGPTQTIALLPGSPAVGTGLAVSGITTDQRGVLRTTPPSLGACEAIILPTSTISTSGFFNSSTWTGKITGMASDAGGSVASVQISIFNGSHYWNGSAFSATSQTFVTATGTTSWSNSLSSSALTSGDTYTIQSKATDQTGHAQSPLTSSTFLYDSAKPSSTISTSGDFNAAGWAAGGSAIKGAATDNGGGFGISVQISIFNGSHYWTGSAFSATSQTFVTATGTTSWSYALPGSDLTNGVTYTIQSKAIDQAGNVQAPLTTSTFIYDTAKPTSTISTSGDYNAARWSAAGSAIKGTATDNGGGAAITSVQISIFNGSHYWTGKAFSATAQTFVTATGTATWSYSLSSSVLTSGVTYTIQSKATDAAGNVQAPLTIGKFLYDTAKPTSAISTKGAYTAATWKGISGTASDNGGGAQHQQRPDQYFQRHALLERQQLQQHHPDLRDRHRYNLLVLRPARRRPYQRRHLYGAKQGHRRGRQRPEPADNR